MTDTVRITTTRVAIASTKADQRRRNAYPGRAVDIQKNSTANRALHVQPTSAGDTVLTAQDGGLHVLVVAACGQRLQTFGTHGLQRTAKGVSS